MQSTEKSAAETVPSELEQARNLPTDKFLQRYRNVLSDVFQAGEPDIHNTFLSAENWKKLVQAGALLPAIAQERGGRADSTLEFLSIHTEASRYSLPLSLYLGIVNALFLRNLRKYGSGETQDEIFPKFHQGATGGLAVSEPGYGTEAFNMQTSYREIPKGGYRISGEKHWQGLSGSADYWLVAAREKDKNGDLSRHPDLFFCREGLRLERNYETSGLKMIPYGRSAIDVVTRETRRALPDSTKIAMWQDIFLSSRVGFPAMTLGFLEQNFDKAQEHCSRRPMGNDHLINFDQVQSRLAKMQAYETICRAMVSHTAKNIKLDDVLDQGNRFEVAKQSIRANAHKALITEYMAESARHGRILQGGMGFETSNYFSRAMEDSWPFQIFEGPNDTLYSQISTSLATLIKTRKHESVADLLKNFDLTKEVAGKFTKLFDFTFDRKRTPQRKLVLLGQAMARIIAFQYLEEMGSLDPKQQPYVHNAQMLLYMEIEEILGNYKSEKFLETVEGVREQWQNIFL